MIKYFNRLNNLIFSNICLQSFNLHIKRAFMSYICMFVDKTKRLNGKILLFMTLFATPAFAEWQMFSDGVDTYLFNTQSGDVYVRFRKGGKNYEDVFVKMPAGVRPTNQNKAKQPAKNAPQNPQQSTQNPPKTPTSPQTPNNEITQAQKLEAIKKSQEILNKSIDSSDISAGF